MKVVRKKRNKRNKSRRKYLFALIALNTHALDRHLSTCLPITRSEQRHFSLTKTHTYKNFFLRERARGQKGYSPTNADAQALEARSDAPVGHL